MKTEQCSEMLAFKLQTPVNHPDESIQHSEHAESLKSRTLGLFCTHVNKSTNSMQLTFPPLVKKLLAYYGT
jgi:hypothetical protein